MKTQLTQKELMYLEDALSMEAREISKYRQAANQAQDTQTKGMLQSIADMHQGHFNTLKQHLS